MQGYSSQAHRPVFAIALIFATTCVLTGCEREALKSEYAQALVQPVSAEFAQPGHVRIRFKEPMATMYYAAGVDYRINGEDLQVAIVRCQIRLPCKPLIEAVRPAQPHQPLEVVIPFNGKRVVMIHTDGQQIAPL